jgi:predicted nucleotidyltransferase
MELIEKNIEQLRALCIIHKVKELYVFGSILSESFTKDSDLDLLVEFGKIDLLDYFDNFMDFKESLEHLFNLQVDLVEVQTVKNPILKRSIDQNKIFIYGRTDTKVAV